MIIKTLEGDQVNFNFEAAFLQSTLSPQKVYVLLFRAGDFVPQGVENFATNILTQQGFNHHSAEIQQSFTMYWLSFFVNTRETKD